jgi:hypothetical protein
LEFEVEFYQKENGNVPVLDFLLSLQPKMRAKAYSEIELLKKFSSDISRIFYFCYERNTFIL